MSLLPVLALLFIVGARTQNNVLLNIRDARALTITPRLLCVCSINATSNATTIERLSLSNDALLSRLSVPGAHCGFLGAFDDSSVVLGDEAALVFAANDTTVLQVINRPMDRLEYVAGVNEMNRIIGVGITENLNVVQFEKFANDTIEYRAIDSLLEPISSISFHSRVKDLTFFVITEAINATMHRVSLLEVVMPFLNAQTTAKKVEVTSKQILTPHNATFAFDPNMCLLYTSDQQSVNSTTIQLDICLNFSRYIASTINSTTTPTTLTTVQSTPLTTTFSADANTTGESLSTSPMPTAITSTTTTSQERSSSATMPALPPVPEKEDYYGGVPEDPDYENPEVYAFDGLPDPRGTVVGMPPMLGGFLDSAKADDNRIGIVGTIAIIIACLAFIGVFVLTMYAVKNFVASGRATGGGAKPWQNF